MVTCLQKTLWDREHWTHTMTSFWCLVTTRTTTETCRPTPETKNIPLLFLHFITATSWCDAHTSIKPLQPLAIINCRCLFFFVQTPKRSKKSVVYGVTSNLSPFVPALHRLKWTPSLDKERLLFGGETFYPVDDGADSRLCATESNIFWTHWSIWVGRSFLFQVKGAQRKLFSFRVFRPRHAAHERLTGNKEGTKKC